MTEKGQSGAHTRPQLGDGEAEGALSGADPLASIEGMHMVERADLLALAAELDLPEKRERGRPKGALNRKNSDMIAYLTAQGHRDPWVTLSLIQTADTAKLAYALGEPRTRDDGTPVKDKNGKPVIDPFPRSETLKLQIKAAEAILPYHHAKKPVQLDLMPADARRPVMVIGEMNVSVAGDLGFMSAGIAPDDRAEKANEINGTAVRQSDVSHE